MNKKILTAAALTLMLVGGAVSLAACNHKNVNVGTNGTTASSTDATTETRYQYLVLTGKLTEHLNQVDKEAREKVEMLVEQMAEQWGVTEKLKMQDQMEWVRKMNNIRSRVVEIIDVELICV